MVLILCAKIDKSYAKSQKYKHGWSENAFLFITGTSVQIDKLKAANDGDADADIMKYDCFKDNTKIQYMNDKKVGNIFDPVVVGSLLVLLSIDKVKSDTTKYKIRKKNYVYA